MSKIRTDRIGKTYLVSNGDMVEIIEYFSNKNITLLFSDGTITKNNFFSSLKRGSIKNPNHLSVYGVGYIGQGVFKHEIGKKSSKSYHVWAICTTKGNSCVGIGKGTRTAYCPQNTVVTNSCTEMCTKNQGCVGNDVP